MKSTTNLVTFATKLSASMQFGQNDFNRTLAFCLVHTARNPTSVINNGTTSVFVNNNFDMVTITSQCFINTIIHNLGYQVMQATTIRATNIHARSFSNRFKPFQNLNIARIIFFRFHKDMFILFFHNISHQSF